MNKYIQEFIGTFFLVLTVGISAVLGAAGDLAPLAIGFVLMVMIFSGGHISGAHYNPAVTIAVFFRGRCSTKDALSYFGAQILAGVVAAVLVTKVFAGAVDGIAAEVEVFSFGASLPVLLAEFLFTFALGYVVVNVATAKGTENNSFYGLAIGGTVVVGAFTVGAISLGGFNPAVSVGLIVMGKLGVGDSWMHFLPQVLGGALAGFTFKALNPNDQ